MLFKQMPETKEGERPWQEDIDRLQQTLQEVLQTISRLSGVELTPAETDPQSGDNSTPQLDCKTLKDRIRTDLEAFAATTASEMARQAERQTRVALAAIHNEATGQVDQVARELREKLHGQFEPGHFEIGITQQTQDRIAELVQRRTDEFARWVWLMCKGTGTPIPIQIEKLLEPYVQEATDRFTEAFRLRFHNQLAEQEQMAQRRLQGTLSSIEGQMNALEQAARNICEQSADSATKLSSDRMNVIAEEAAKHFQDRIREQFESDFNVYQTRLEQTADAVLEKLQQEEAEKAGSFSSRIQGLESEVAEKAMAQISGSMEQASLNVVASSVQHLHQQADDTLEHSREEVKAFLELQMEEVRLRISELGQSARESFSREAEERVASLRKLDQEIAAVRDKGIADSMDQISKMIQGTLGAMKDQIRQVAGEQLLDVDNLVREAREKEATQYEAKLNGITDTWYKNLLERVEAEAKEAGVRVAAEVRANSDSVMQELSDKVDASALVLREETSQATSRIEETLKSSLENYQQQLAQITESRIAEHREVIRKSLTDLQVRLERSAQALRQEIDGNLEADA
jgi:hypothetical protein